MKKYTIKDIAKLAGVSKGTVDRVLHKRGKVSETALKKVNSILDDIDFKPNFIAKQLKNNKIYTICVLLPDPKKDAYWESCIVGINKAVLEFNAFGIHVEIYFFNPTSTASFLKANLTIQAVALDAVLLVPLFFKEASTIIEEYSNSGITVSIFNNHINSSPAKNFIGQDLFQSGRIGAKLLSSIISKGGLAIIHIDEKYNNAIHMQEKEKGFKSYFQELNAPKYNIITYKLKHSNIEKTLTSIMAEHPELKGIFVTTSKSYQVAEILQNEHEKKIALVGYDLLRENISFLKKGNIDFLIHQNPKQQAYLGLKHLIEHFLFDKEIPSQILLPINIINSESIKTYTGD